MLSSSASSFSLLISLFEKTHPKNDGKRPRKNPSQNKEKLESVVKQKHGADAGNSSTAQANNRTNIICKHFLDAVEKKAVRVVLAVPEREQGVQVQVSERGKGGVGERGREKEKEREVKFFF